MSSVLNRRHHKADNHATQSSEKNDSGEQPKNADNGTRDNSQEQPQNQPSTLAAAVVLTTDSLYYLSGVDAAQNLRKYRYHGQDLSLVYKYLLSPLASFCVNYLTPSWLAPNSITLIGMVCMMSSYLIFWYYVPLTTTTTTINNNNGDGMFDDLPRWIFVYHGCAMLIYQTLDNMDGKQARRTNSSSPLGLLFDHGIDALNSLIGSTNWMISMALQLNNSEHAILCWIIFMGPYTQFFIVTWEEYHTGSLVLPIMNGPSEGLILGACQSFASAIYGPKQYWQGRSWCKNYIIPALSYVGINHNNNNNILQWIQTLTNAQVLVYMFTIGVLQEIAMKIYTTSHDHGRLALKRLFPVIAIIACSLFMDAKLWCTNPRTSMHLGALLYVEMITALMLDHTTQQEFVCWRWQLFPLVIGTILNRFTNLLPVDDDLRRYLTVYTSMMAAYLLFKFTILIHECCSVLNIWCFDITTPCPRVYYGNDDEIKNNSNSNLQNKIDTASDKVKQI